MRHETSIVVVLVAVQITSCGNKSEGRICNPGSMQKCVYPGCTQDGIRMCNEDGSGWGDCKCNADVDNVMDSEIDADAEIEDACTEIGADTDVDADSECSDPNTCFNLGCGRECNPGGNDCPPGLQCLAHGDAGTGMCTMPCDRNDDRCGCYWHCGTILDGTDDTLWFCQPGGDYCRYDGDCGDVQKYACRLSLEDRNGNGKIDGLAGRCIRLSDADVDCRESCTYFCRKEFGDADCPQGFKCVTITVGLGENADVPSASIDVCTASGVPCERDENCAGFGQVCGLSLALSPACIDPACDRGTEHCLDSGDACDGVGGQCYNYSCMGQDGEYRCYEFCRRGHDEDCDVPGQTCKGIPIHDEIIYVCVTPDSP